MHTLTPRLTSELKLSYSDDNLWWDRAHPEIPTLARAMATCCRAARVLCVPESQPSLEAIYSTVWTRNRHVITAGRGLLLRCNSGYLTAARRRIYLFRESSTSRSISRVVSVRP